MVYDIVIFSNLELPDHKNKILIVMEEIGR